MTKTQTTVRLTEETHKTLEQIKTKHGMSSIAAAIEYLAQLYRDKFTSTSK